MTHAQPIARHVEFAELKDLPFAELVDRFEIGVENFDRRVFELTDAQLDQAFLPEAGVGRWPCRVLLGHLADAELPFVMRMRRIVAEEHPMLQPWDETAFVDSGMYGTPETGEQYPIAGFVAAVHTLRKWTASWLRTLTPQQTQRTGLHPERGEQTVAHIAAWDTYHLEHHAYYLNLKVKKFRG